MDNDKKLFEGLLKADGIDPAGISESERAAFKEMLETEKKNLNRHSWPLIAVLWIFYMIMFALCISEETLEALRIPFVVAGLGLTVGMWFMILRWFSRHYRKVKESGRKINKLYYLVHGKHRGIVMVGQKDGKRIVYWPRIIAMAIVLWVFMSLGGAGVWYLLCQGWIYSSSPWLHIIYCTVFSLSFVIVILYAGIKTPLDELPEVKSKSKQSKQSKPAEKPNIWRIIMKNRITKLAAAAIIIIAALLGVNSFLGTGSSVAWADVVEQISQVRPYACRMTFDFDGDRPDLSYRVFHKNLSVRREERDDGRILVFDMSQKPVRTLVLYPSEKRAREEVLLDREPLKDPDLLRMIASRQNGDEEDLGLSQINGRTVKGFHSPNKHNEFTVWADVETNLPVLVELRQSSSARTIIMEDFEFVVEFDESLFDTTAPDDYAVQRTEIPQ